MTKEQVIFWLLFLRFNPDNNVLPNEVIDIAIGAIVAQPEQPESCDGCKWEDAFGYGECRHCKRRFEDMYERKEGETHD